MKMKSCPTAWCGFRMQSNCFFTHLAPFPTCISSSNWMSHLNHVEAQQSTCSNKSTPHASDNGAGFHTRLSRRHRQRSLLFCDILKLHLYVEVTCDVELRTPYKRPSVKCSLYVHLKDLAVTQNRSGKSEQTLVTEASLTHHLAVQLLWTFANGELGQWQTHGRWSSAIVISSQRQRLCLLEVQNPRAGKTQRECSCTDKKVATTSLMVAEFSRFTLLDTKLPTFESNCCLTFALLHHLYRKKGHNRRTAINFIVSGNHTLPSLAKLLPGGCTCRGLFAFTFTQCVHNYLVLHPERVDHGSSCCCVQGTK